MSRVRPTRHNVDMEQMRWTANQREVIARLLGRDVDLRPIMPLPTFPTEIARRIEVELERELAPVADGYTSKHPLVVTKRHLAALFRCEGFLLADEFEWSVQKLRGTVVHKAMSLLLLSRFAEMSSFDIAEQVVEAVAVSDQSAGEFLAGCSEVERGELTLACADMVTKFRAGWPPIDRSWKPRIESPANVALCDGRILLKAKYDLALGMPGSNPSEVIIVDFKSGQEYPEHIEELRHYALMETIRSGVPPRKVAAYYLDASSFRDEDVTEDVLLSARHRLSDGVRRIAALWMGEREPELTPGPMCPHCPAFLSCAVGQESVRQHKR